MVVCLAFVRDDGRRQSGTSIGGWGRRRPNIHKLDAALIAVANWVALERGGHRADTRE
jgi:hypothetical protein